MSKRAVDRSSVFSSLMGEVKELAEAGEQRTLPTEKVLFNAEQPRKYISDDSLAALTESVKQHGVLEPVLVRQTEAGYELIAGERRTRAALAAGLTSIPAIVLELDEVQALEISVIENLQREDLNPVEETDAILNLLAIRLGSDVPDAVTLIRQLYDESRGRLGNNVISNHQREEIERLFRTVGRFSPSSFYTNRIPILNYPPELLEPVRAGQLHYTKAKKLARIPDETVRQALLERTLRENLSVADLEQAVREALAKPPPTAAAALARDVKRRLSPKEIAKLSATDQREVSSLLARLQKLLGG